ncbi:hypothetical protein GBAR_LOCUS25786 [Geodia barretti]|uniref:Uncharacterized protein n=1 Tax=Geodia barretti TaxID=519541 RepID=A0AA35TEP8_GEOBA|nr:hypothetical protein GBAR_LOCUS25786 [Geodia barretti]
MASRRAALFALPTSITEEKEAETEFVITNGNVSDRDDSESDTSEEIEKVDLCTTITNTATAAEVPPHILERRFRFHHTPLPTKEVEKVDLSTAPPVTPRPIVMPKEPTVEIPPHVLERRRSSAFQKPAEINELSVLEETEEKDDNGEEWELDDAANFFEFGDDFMQLLSQMSTITDGDFEDTSNL